MSIATCGTCERSWDDSIITSMTPAPSARCPFENFHEWGDIVPEDWPVAEIKALYTAAIKRADGKQMLGTGLTEFWCSPMSHDACMYWVAAWVEDDRIDFRFAGIRPAER